MGTPILMFCLGGQKTSLLAKTLHNGGMSLGNEVTGWKQAWFDPHCEFSEITTMMNVYNEIPVDPQKSKGVVRRIEEILRSYKSEADKHNWKYYGIKTSAGICANKWNTVKEVYYREWPDALFFSLIRKPVFSSDGNMEGWYNVLPARMEVLNTGRGVILPYPEIYMSGEIEKFIRAIGLSWTDSSMLLFKSKRYEEGVRDSSESEMQSQYEQILHISRENFQNLFGETLEMRGV